jgi:glycosyltransferase involved in cell wall biosynthesis
MKLSFVMMVKNEAKHIEEVLKSIIPIRQEIESEIIVVDTGSTDETVEIAKKYTEKVYFHQWNDDFASMRNKSIDYARGEWIFILDGDEVISNSEGLIAFFQSGKDKQYNSLYVNLKNIVQKEENKFNVAVLARLFRNITDFKYVGTIHEQPLKQGPSFLLDLTLIHYGYLSTDEELMERKFNRNSSLLKKELEKDPDNIYYLHQLFNTYAMYKKHDIALDYSKRAYEVAKKKKIKLSKAMYIYSDLATALLNNNRIYDVEKVCKEAIKVKDGFMDFYFYLSKVQMNMGKYYDAIINYEKYLLLAKEHHGSPDRVDTTVTHYTLGAVETAYSDLCVLYAREKEYGKVKLYASKIKKSPNIKNITPTIINSYLELEEYKELGNFASETLLQYSDDVINSFYKQLEIILFNMKDKQKIVETFATGNSQYNVLNKIRLEIEKENMESNEWILSSINKMDFSNLPNYYGDILYYLLKTKYSLYDLLIDVKESILNNYFQYLSDRFDDLSKIIYEYIQFFTFQEDIKKVRVNKPLLRYALILNKIPDESYQLLFNRYLTEGIFFIKNYYHDTIIESEKIYDVKSDEDAFMIYLLKAELQKDKSEVTYIQYLRKALEAYPQMKTGIGYLLEKSVKVNQNMDLYNELERIKESIISLFLQDLHDEALKIIDQTLLIVTDDTDLYSIRAVILMKKGNYKEAEITLNKALTIDPEHIDSLYNLAYIYEKNNQINRAVDLYKKVLVFSNEKDLLEEVKGKILNCQQTLRQMEMKRRVENSKFAKKQELILMKNKSKENVHVVYVLTHVGICGGVKIILEQANRLTKLGIKVSLVCHYPMPTWYPVEAKYIEVPFDVELSTGIPDCDVIVATYWDHIQACIDKEIAPVVYFEQGDFHLFDYNNMDENLKKFIYQQYQLPQFIFTVTKQAANIIKKVYNREAKVIHNAVDTSVFNNKSSNSSNGGIPYILMMGDANVKFKGLDHIIKAYKKVRNTNSDVQLYWITPTNPPNEYASIVDKYFVNPSQHKIAELYRGASLYVSASHYESFSLPVLEAMACGCPVVTTGNNGVLEYAKDNYNVLITEIGDSDDTAKKILKVLRDNDLKEKLVSGGLTTLKTFSWDSITPDLVKMYDEIAGYEVNKVCMRI